jgi:hypothetical protein
VYTDTVSIGGLSATNQSLAVVSKMAKNFFGDGTPVDGILGTFSSPLLSSSFLPPD